MTEPATALACPETEATVLHAWCTDPVFAKAHRLDPSWFTDPRYHEIAAALAQLDAPNGDEAHLLAVLRERGQLERIGGPQAVFRITHLAPAYGDPWPYVQRLAEYAALRRLTAALDQAVAQGRASADLAGTITAVHDALRGSQLDLGGRAVTVQAMLRIAANACLTPTDQTRIPTDMEVFDRETGGLRLGFCTVLGAPTSWGKSSFAVMVADVALRHTHRPLLVTCEDSLELYGRRLLGRRASINAFRLREGLLDPTERARIDATIAEAETVPFYLDGCGRSVERLASDIRSLCVSEGCDLVLFDYLQAVTTTRRTQDRRTEITYIARTIMDTIKGVGAAGLLFSQLRRPNKGEGRPGMHDLKESGDVENAAEMVLIGYTNADRELRLLVEKCKDGRRGEYVMGWNSALCCFTGSAPVHESEEAA
jgi:replicative DNA helicase